MSNFNGFTGDNDPVYYSRQTENADGALTNEDTKRAGNSPVIPDEMTSELAYEIGDYHGDPVDVFARGANWMRRHIIDSISAATSQEEKQ
jgi:hypothetical protein